MKSERGIPSYLPVQLHISHGWGGGTERWIQDYCRSDSHHQNLLLRAISDRNSTAFRLELIEPARSPAPILAWQLLTPIRASAVSHAEYAEILAGIMNGFQVSSLIVSSLIGHSFEVLATTRPTIVILHDLYPFCPAIFGCYGQPCQSCSTEILNACLIGNPLNSFWHNSRAVDWITLRQVYAERIRAPHVRVVAPSTSVFKQWAVLQPELADLPWARIPHGIDAGLLPTTPFRPAQVPLRIVIPGRLSQHKGLALLQAALPGLLRHARIMLLGSGEFGRPFQAMDGVEVIENFHHTELAGIIHRFAPDCAMLLSIYQESFSYTLSEMFALGLPVLATRLGAFSERIKPGITGELFPPDPAQVVATVAALAQVPAKLESLRHQVAAQETRSLDAMMGDYRQFQPQGCPAKGSPSVHRHLENLHQMAVERTRLEEEIHHLRKELSEKNATTASLVHQLEESTHRNTHLEVHLNETLHSHSWQITAPLRHAVSVLRRRTAPPAPTTLPCPTAAPLPGAIRSLDLNPQYRNRARRQAREWLAIPDWGRILASVGPFASVNDAREFLAIASDLCAGRNNLCTVLIGVDIKAPCWDEHNREALGALIATRRLFLVESTHDVNIFILSADALLPACNAQLARDACWAQQAELPLVTIGAQTNVGHDMRSTTQPDIIHSPTLQGAREALHAWLDAHKPPEG